MTTILFVVSFTIVIMYMVGVVSVLVGNDVSVPTPIGHTWGVSFSNTYISTPAILYQVYFWFTYAEVLV